MHRRFTALLGAAFAVLLLAGCSEPPEVQPVARSVVDSLRLRSEEGAGSPKLEGQTVKMWPTYWVARGTLPGGPDRVVQQASDQMTSDGWTHLDTRPSASFDQQVRFTKDGVTTRLTIGQPADDTVLEPLDGAVYVIVEVGQSDSGPAWTESS